MQILADLRSDTVTRPTEGMREAMMKAPLGDDVLGDDPTVAELERKFASHLGKEAAVFVPTGTMANQASLRALTEHGDEIICHEDSHIIHYETGAPAALSGCMIRALRGERGQFDADQVAEVIRPVGIHGPVSKVVSIENTQNRGGGSVWPRERIAGITALARERGLKLHLDGARLWNASAASGVTMADYASAFDTVSCCFSKGLGTPAGSAVAGSAGVISRVRRFRKMFGGAMRQAGVLAAAAVYAMDHHVDRLKEDHANAKALAAGVREIKGLTLEPGQAEHGVETNIVYFDLDRSLPFDGAGLTARLKERGVLALNTGPRRVRMLTHLDVPRAKVDVALDVLRAVVRAV